MTPDRTCANLGGSRAIKNVPPPHDHRCILLDEHTFTKRSGKKKRVCSSAQSGSTGLKGKLTGHYNPNVLSGPSGGMNRVKSPPRATDETSGKHPQLSSSGSQKGGLSNNSDCDEVASRMWYFTIPKTTPTIIYHYVRLAVSEEFTHGR